MGGARFPAAVPHLLSALVACAPGCASAPVQPSKAWSWPSSSGQVDRGEWEAHLGSSQPDEVARLLGPQLARQPDLTVILGLVKNRSRETPVRVDPATFRLTLKNGEVLKPLTVEEVKRWAAVTGSTIPFLTALEAGEVRKGEALATAAVFRLPAGADASSAEVEMRVEPGPPEGAVPVRSRLF